jgi:excisionase family DNA binding protein
MESVTYQRVCKCCGTKFTTTTATKRFCTNRCAKRASAERIRKAKERVERIGVEPSRKFVSVNEASEYLGVSRQYIYYMIKYRGMPAHSISQRKTLIEVNAMKAFVKAHPYLDIERRKKSHEPKQEAQSDEVAMYSVEEIIAKYNVRNPLARLRYHNIKPIRKSGTFNYYSAAEIDDIFAVDDSEEWVTTPEISERYGIKANRIYAIANKCNITRKKIGTTIYYSLKEFDAIRTKTSSSSSMTYISYQDAMRMAEMNRNQLDYLIRKHNIRKIRAGKLVSVCKGELEAALKSIRSAKK